jgi:hypothetical protein
MSSFWPAKVEQEKLALTILPELAASSSPGVI